MENYLEQTSNALELYDLSKNNNFNKESPNDIFFQTISDNKKTVKNINDEIFQDDSPTNYITKKIPKNKINIENIIFVAYLDSKLNLETLVSKYKNSKGNSTNKNHFILKIKEPKADVYIYKTGKIICKGAKSKENLLKVVKNINDLISELGYKIYLNNFNIIEIEGTIDVKFSIKLNSLYYNLLKKNKAKQISYEPEIYSGLIYHMNLPKITLIIYSSGIIKFFGAKNREDIYNVWEKIYPLLAKSKIDMEKNFKKKHI